MFEPYEFPLCWPDKWPRTKSPGTSRFKTAISAAMENARREIKLFGTDTGLPVKRIIISSNVTLGTSKPSDPGVAVWFFWDNEWRCFPVDLYLKPEDNLQAISKIIEADRVKMRHGGIQFVRASFKAYTGLSLPAPSWRADLMFPPDAKPTIDEIEAQYRALAKKFHPDSGGDRAKFEAITAARQAAKRELEAA